ncbi:hypothetical protein BDV93DRAFT_526782, partial [Ceratobasidium sp. AG-I]
MLRLSEINYTALIRTALALGLKLSGDAEGEGKLWLPDAPSAIIRGVATTSTINEAKTAAAPSCILLPPFLFFPF